jgi:hypothetical protein
MAGLIGLLATSRIDNMLYPDEHRRSYGSMEIEPHRLHGSNGLYRATFILPRTGDRIDELFIKIHLPCLATHRRDPNDCIGDCIGEHIIDQITLDAGNGLIHWYDADYIHIHTHTTKTDQQINKYKKIIRYNNGTLTIPFELFGTIPCLPYYPPQINITFADLRRVAGCRDNCVGFSCSLLARCVVHSKEKHIEINREITYNIENVRCEEFLVSDPAGVVGYKHMKQRLYDDNFAVHGTKCINDLIFSYLDPDLSDTTVFTMHIDLTFDCLCKELIWVCVPVESVGSVGSIGSVGSVGSIGSIKSFEYKDMIQRARITAHGHQLVDMGGDFFTTIQQYSRTNQLDNVYVYRFGDGIGSNNPVNAINLSRCPLGMDLDIRHTGSAMYKIKVYAVGLDVLEIREGMGMLHFPISVALKPPV